jgi:betaine-aldehyde dehydrogenase
VSTSTAERFARHLINGEWIDSGQKADSFNPATGETIGRYVKAGAEEALQAIAVAKDIFDNSDWRFDKQLRAKTLNAMADAFEARSEELVEILALENGKIKPEARFEVSLSGPTLRFNAALALTDTGRAAVPVKGRITMVVRQPAGVSGIIAPWNSPVALVLRSLAPALAAGTTAVVNLPTSTAQTNALIAEIVSSTPGLPTGVVNFLIGGRESASAIITSPDVPVISFTGSTKTGKSISADAAPNLKRMGLELGVKTPMLVFDDADLDVSIPIIVRALTTFAGQFCMTGSRVLVGSKIAPAVRERLGAALEAIKVGPAADPTSEMGAIIDKPNVERINGMVEDALAAGASVIARGGPITEGELAKGAFYRPTLLEVTDSKLTIVQQEVFGPVLTLQTFEDEATAISLANDSEYGLSAAIFSTDVDLPLRVALQIDAGTIWVNDWAVLYDQSEEGGFKGSGQGRMRGLAVIDDFIEYKHIALRPGFAAVPQV